MSKKKFIILVSLGVIIFGVLFYWNAIRPSQIKKKCYRQSREKTSYAEGVDRMYNQCLKANGL
jgi:hypothetical protein